MHPGSCWDDSPWLGMKRDEMGDVDKYQMSYVRKKKQATISELPLVLNDGSGNGSKNEHTYSNKIPFAL